MESGSENMELNQEIEDDVVEVEVQEAPPDGNVSVETSSTQSRRRLKSDVWDHFEMLPLIPPNKKQRYKCKKCGTTYACPSTFGTGNLHKHIEKCVRRDTRDIGQLLITRESSCLNLATPKFSQARY